MSRDSLGLRPAYDAQKSEAAHCKDRKADVKTVFIEKTSHFLFYLVHKDKSDCGTKSYRDRGAL